MNIYRSNKITACGEFKVRPFILIQPETKIRLIAETDFFIDEKNTTILNYLDITQF